MSTKNKNEEALKKHCQLIYNDLFHGEVDKRTMLIVPISKELADTLNQLVLPKSGFNDITELMKYTVRVGARLQLVRTVDVIKTGMDRFDVRESFATVAKTLNSVEKIGLTFKVKPYQKLTVKLNDVEYRLFRDFLLSLDESQTLNFNYKRYFNDMAMLMLLSNEMPSEDNTDNLMAMFNFANDQPWYQQTVLDWFHQLNGTPEVDEPVVVDESSDEAVLDDESEEDAIENDDEDTDDSDTVVRWHNMVDFAVRFNKKDNYHPHFDNSHLSNEDITDNLIHRTLDILSHINRFTVHEFNLGTNKPKITARTYQQLALIRIYQHEDVDIPIVSQYLKHVMTEAFNDEKIGTSSELWSQFHYQLAQKDANTMMQRMKHGDRRMVQIVPDYVINESRYIVKIFEPYAMKHLLLNIYSLETIGDWHAIANWRPADYQKTVFYRD